MKKLEELDCLSMVSNIGWRSFSDKRWSKGRKKEVQGRKKKGRKREKEPLGVMRRNITNGDKSCVGPT